MKDDYIRIRLSSLDKEKLRKLAEKNQMNMSEYIVEIIRRESEKKV